MRTPKQWETSYPEQSHRQDRTAGQIFSSILHSHSIFPLRRELLNVNQNHMAGKSQLCEPQEPRQKHHHLCHIPCSTIRFLSVAWNYVDSRLSPHKELARGGIRVHYTMIIIWCFWAVFCYYTKSEADFKSGTSIPKVRTYLRHLWNTRGCPQSDTTLSSTSSFSVYLYANIAFSEVRYNTDLKHRTRWCFALRHYSCWLWSLRVLRYHEDSKYP